MNARAQQVASVLEGDDLTTQHSLSAFKRRIAPRTLKAQLLTGGAVSVLLAAAITTFVNLRLAEAEARRLVESQMLDTAAALATALQGQPPDQAQAALTAFSRATGAEAGYRVEVVDTETRVLAATEPEYVGRPVAEAMSHPEPELLRVLSGERPLAFAAMTRAGMPVLDVSLPLYGDPTDPVRITGALHLAVPHQAVTGMTRRLLVMFGLSALLLALLLIAPLWFYLEHSLLRPMQILITANRAVNAGQLEGRSIPSEAMPSHELGEVMRTRNDMLGRLEKAEDELRRRLRELSALTSAAALLSEAASLDELLTRALDKAVEITDNDAGEVSLFDPATERLQVSAYRGFSAAWLAEEVDRPTTCLCGQVVYRREPLCLTDMTDDARVVRPACMREGFRSFCAVPLEAEGQLMGVLSLHSRQPRQPSAGQRDLLIAIGNQLAVALQNVRLYEQTRQLATTDSLTGLINRRHFLELAEREFERARRYQRPLCAILLDIDHFKRVNDTYGHAIGDQVLRTVASRCRESLRDIDLLGRYGGEEFVALLPENDLPGARQAAERLRQVVADAPIETERGSLAVTISVGVSVLTEACPDLATLLDRADAAMYAAKRAGRNRVEDSVCLDTHQDSRGSAQS